MASRPMDQRRGLRLPVAAADALAVCAILAVALATRALWLGDPVADFDEQLYSFIGWRMTEGELPFVDWWDRKPFGLFAIFAFAHAIGGPSALAYQLLALGFATGGAVIVYALARRLVDAFTATAAASIHLMLLAAYSSYSAQSEVFFVPMMAGMVWLLSDPAHPAFRRRALWAILLGGLALQVKYTVLPQCVALGGWALWHEWRRRPDIAALMGRAALFALLGLAPTAAVALFYALQGEFAAFAHANFLSFFDRLPAPQGRWSDEHYIGVAPLLLLAGLGLYAGWRFSPPRDRSLYVLMVLWAASTLATVLLPGTVYLYYYAALSAPVALVALPLLDRTGPGRFVPALLALSVLFWLLNVPERRLGSLAEREAAAQLAAAIAPHVGGQSDCLWVQDGPTALYRLSGSCVPTRYVYPDHLHNALETNALGVGQEAEVARILAGRPGAIVTADRAVTVLNPAVVSRVEKALTSDYEPALSVEMHGRTLTAWIRTD